MPVLSRILCVLVFTTLIIDVNSGGVLQRHHHRHHKHHRRVASAIQSKGSRVPNKSLSGNRIAQDVNHIAAVKALTDGSLNVNGPLPIDFSDRFAEAVAEATGCKDADIKLLGAMQAEASGLMSVTFRSDQRVVADVLNQASNPESKLANGQLHSFLVAKDSVDANQTTREHAREPEPHSEPEEHIETEQVAEESDESETGPALPKNAENVGPEVDMSMPYGDLEPFGREDTAQELTESSIRESNEMVDQLERAEVAEEKRAVFRALTRLRGAAITSFDGIARSQTGNIDDYARNNQWRKAHPVRHLAQDEADVSKWAFPDPDCDEDKN